MFWLPLGILNYQILYGKAFISYVILKIDLPMYSAKEKLAGLPPVECHTKPIHSDA